MKSQSFTGERVLPTTFPVADVLQRALTYSLRLFGIRHDPVGD